MALLFMDSFDHYVTADLTEKYTATTVTGGTLAIQAAGGRRSSASLRCSGTINNQTCAAVLTVTPSGTTVVAGFSFKVDTAPPATSGLGLFSALDTTAQWTLAMLSDGRLELKNAGVGGAVLATSTATIALSTAVYLEVKVVIHNTAGTVEVRVDTVPVITATGLDTQGTSNTQWGGVQLGLSTAASWTGTADFDDVYILDGAGAAPLNTFLGDCRVDARYPTGAGATTGWTPSTGANYACVDESAPNDDTDYVEAATTALTDTYVVEDAVAGGVLQGVQLLWNVKKTASGSCSVAPVVRHSGSNVSGMAQNPGTAYAYGRQVYATNPGTSAAWTEADFNAAEFGVTRTA